MKTKFWSVILGATLALMLAVPASAAVTTNDKVPFAGFAFVPCANGGAGDLVALGGTLHILSSLTVDNAGGVHVKGHFQPQNVQGQGLFTGNSYRGTGATNQHLNINAGGLPVTSTSVNTFNLIGQGRAENLRVHQTFHITINENGVLTATVANTKITCK